jgi:urease accessory protein
MAMKGMRSEVAIEVAIRSDISYLASSYFTPPFKVVNITEDKHAGFLDLILMCSSPGVLDGDEASICIGMGEGARMRLCTQSYQRLFNMKHGAAASMEVRMDKGACFCWLPHPCVPHEGAVFTGKNRVFINEGCQLVWGEVLTCGRKLNGEVFGFSKYHVRTEIFIRDQLVLVDNICLRPSVISVGGPGQMEGFTHQASLLYVGGLGMSRDEIERYLAILEGTVYGVSEGPAGSLVVRILGNKAEPLHTALKVMAGMLSCFKPMDHAS